ncbi:MAG: M20 family metallopeptidase [Terriglobales bacterium]
MRAWLQYFEERRGEIVGLIRQLVERESPSNNKGAANRCADFIAGEFERRGGRVRLHRQQNWGDHVEVRFEGGRRPVMLLGHYDTVWDVGTLAQMPWREHDGRLYGPGVFDMKSGIALMLFVLAGMRERRGDLPRGTIVSLNADEEAGSDGSRHTTEALAKEAEAVLVLEPAQGTAVKTARKGVGDYTMKVTGVAAHAGLDFEKGHSAVLELARQIERIAAFTDLQRGLTVNVGVIRGGTRTNVIPAEAVAEVDVRIARLADAEEIDRKFRGLTPVNPHCKVEITGGINRPPLERTTGVARLYEQARGIAAELGFELGEAAVGGGSDGNFTGALGVPTLDGLGAVGEGAHASNESVLVEWLPRRAALLAGMLERV